MVFSTILNNFQLYRAFVACWLIIVLTLSEQYIHVKNKFTDNIFL